MGIIISEEEDIPSDILILIKDLSEPEESSQLIHNDLVSEIQGSTSLIPANLNLPDNNINNDFLSDDDNEAWIESVASGFYSRHNDA